MDKKEVYEHIVSGTAKGFLPSVARIVLRGASKIYEKVVHERNEMYDTHTNDENYIRHMSVPVISVGNITAGGTGKTPFVMYLCQYFRSHGIFPVVLLRGYKAKNNKRSIIVSDGHSLFCKPDESGDEAFLLARSLVHCGVVIGRSRVDSAELAIKTLGAQVLILDDAFQHRKIGRNLDIVLVDATRPFGYGHLIPRGLLREPLIGLKRADIIALTKCNQVDEKAKDYIYTMLAKVAPHTSIMETNHGPKDIQCIEDWVLDKKDYVLDEQDSSRDSTHKKFFAVSAIGNPQSFIETLNKGGYQVVGAKAFLDHYEYNELDIMAMIAAAKEAKADAIIVTEKDAVKLGRKILVANYHKQMPFFVLPITIELETGKEFLFQQLERIVAQIEVKGARL